MDHARFPDDVRHRVLAVLHEQQRSLTWLARALGKSKSWGSAFAHGHGILTMPEMQVLARITGLPTHYFLTGERVRRALEQEEPSMPATPSSSVELLSSIVAMLEALPPDQRFAAVFALARTMESFFPPAAEERTPPPGRGGRRR